MYIYIYVYVFVYIHRFVYIYTYIYTGRQGHEAARRGDRLAEVSV